MHAVMHLSMLQIFKWRRIRIRLALVDLAGRQTITDHLRQKAPWHWHRHIAVLCRIVIRPVFPVMTVAPFMMHPGKGIPIGLAFILCRRMGAVKKADALGKFRYPIFGKIMPEALPENPGFGAVRNDLMAMPCDGLEMSPEPFKEIQYPQPFLSHACSGIGTRPASTTRSQTAPPRQTSPW